MCFQSESDEVEVEWVSMETGAIICESLENCLKYPFKIVLLQHFCPLVCLLSIHTAALLTSPSVSEHAASLIGET